MDHEITGPLIGRIIVAISFGSITLVCIGVALKMLFRPGERDPHHPKYRILRKDR